MPEAGRPDIPAGVKRAVRQRCGYGCVICGLPLYTYEHIDPYASVLEHDEGNLTLLCDRHQRESTNGLLPKEEIARSNRDPVNVSAGETYTYALHYSGARCRVEMGGSCSFWTESRNIAVLRVFSKNLIEFRFEDDELLLSIDWASEDQSQRLLIQDNEMVVTTGIWDIEFVGKRLILRYGLGQIALDLIFETPDLLRIPRGKFSHRGVTVEFEEDGVLVNLGSNRLSGDMGDFSTGIAIGHDKDLNRSGAFAVYPDRLPPDFKPDEDSTPEALERLRNDNWEMAYRMGDTADKPPWM